MQKLNIVYFTILLSLLINCNTKELTVSSNHLNIEENVFKYKGELFTGHVLDAIKSGRVFKSFHCINGLIEGEYLEYYSTGKIKKRNNYKHGLLEGESKYYSEGGEVFLLENYHKGKLSGLYKNNAFKINGELGIFIGSSEGYFENGLQNGYWIYKYPDGRIYTKGKFKNGDMSNLSTSNVPDSGRDGEWLFYNDYGFLKHRLYYNKSDTVKFELINQYGKITEKGMYNKNTLELY